MIHRTKKTQPTWKLRSTIVLAVASCCTALCGVVGCGALQGTSESESIAAAAQPIVRGTPATAFPEAALVDWSSGSCSGSIIAPRIALTAGHCVLDTSKWTVKVPSANKTATSKKAFTTYTNTGENVDPDEIDVAVLILDSPIELPFYPSLATSKSSNGTLAVNVGRIRDGAFSTTALFVGQPIALADGKPDGFPFAYISKEIIQSGDSGGPVYVGEGANRKIVGVNSAAGGGTQILARVDVMYKKIQELITANGGGGGGGDAGGVKDAGASKDSGMVDSGRADASTPNPPRDSGARPALDSGASASNDAGVATDPSVPRDPGTGGGSGSTATPGPNGANPDNTTRADEAAKVTTQAEAEGGGDNGGSGCSIGREATNGTQSPIAAVALCFIVLARRPKRSRGAA